MKKQSFIKGAAVMAGASILCKILSAVFKIPLDLFFLHEDGIAIYQSVYSIYNIFLAICVTGVPIALSSLVAKESDEEGLSLCSSTFTAVTFICTLSSILIFAFARPIAAYLSGGGAPKAEMALRALSPALLFLGVISSLRGFFQGQSNMIPSALGQLGESLTKVVMGILLCAVLVGFGVESGAAGAVLGVSLSAFCAAAVLYLFLRKKGKKLYGKFYMKKAMKVFKLSLPVTLGTFGYAAVMLCDALTVTNVLSIAGVGEDKRIRLFGYLTRANTVYNLPAAIITAITASIVPIISSAIAKKDFAELSENVVKSLKSIFYVASPCAFGLMLFARQIFGLLYSNENSFILLALAGGLVLVLPYVQTTTVMLQSLGKVWHSVVANAVAILLKLILNVVLIRTFGIKGAQIATIIAFLPVFVYNTWLLGKFINLKGAFAEIMKIVLCGALACILARCIYTLGGGIIMLMASIFAAAVLYVFLLVLSGSIKRKEIISLIKRG